jgi:hypothetical protein
VAVHELVAVDQLAHVARVGIDAARRPAGGGVDPDVPAQPDGDRVHRRVGLLVRVRELEPRDHQHPVVVQCPLGHSANGLEVRRERALVDRVGGWVVGTDNVIGDRQDVESPRAVEAGQVCDAELSVAPRRVRVQLAEEGAAGRSGSGGHAPKRRSRRVKPRGNGGDETVSAVPADLW